SAGGLVGWGQWRSAAFLTSKLDILRLTTRGWLRRRRVGSRWVSRSSRSHSSALTRRSGGKHTRRGGDAAPDGAQGVDEGEPVAVHPGGPRGPAHQRAQGVVDQQVGPDLLAMPSGVLLVSTTPGPRWWVLISS